MDQTIDSKNRPSPRKHVPTQVRVFLLTLLVGVIIAAFYGVSHSALADKLKDRTTLLHWANDHSKNILDWVTAHPITAPTWLIVVYVASTLLMLPVWPCQLAAGYCFGLVFGIIWCEIGAVIGAMAALELSHLLVGHWFRARYESRFEKLQRINDKLGHSGLFVVMGIRLCHMLPFGLSNYLFGLTTITVASVALGTFGGGMPAIGVYVILGAGRAKDWRPWAVIATINVLLLIPIAMRYFKSRRLSPASGSPEAGLALHRDLKQPGKK